MNVNVFPHPKNSVPAWNVDLPPNNVFVAPVSIVGQNSYLVENPKDIQTFIEEELTNAGVKLAESEAQAKMRLSCKITVCPVHKSRVPTELLRPSTEYSSIVVEVQLTQKHDQQLRLPYYDTSRIRVEPNENVMAGIKDCLRDLLQKLTKKKND